MGNSIDLKSSGVQSASNYKSKLLFRIFLWSSLIHIIGIGLLARALFWYMTRSTWYKNIPPSSLHVKWTHGVFCILPFLTLDTLLILMLLSPLNKRIRPLPKSRCFRKLYVCLVTRGTNTVFRTIYEMQNLHKVDSRIQLVVLQDAGTANFESLRYFGVDIVRVPAEFQPQFARHKARALEFFRIHTVLGDDDWVLHLDEETIVDDHCVMACIDFIEREVNHDYGQGLIIYNDANYWQNWILSYVEIARFREDLTRFQFAHNMIHLPLHGFHGSFALFRGVVENDITWETDCLAEDFWFALGAWRKGYSGGFIHGIAREQSNQTFRDYFFQRRRWQCGIWTLGYMGKFNVVFHTLGNLSFVPMFLVTCGVLPQPFWVLVWATICLAYHWYSVAFSAFIQDVDADVPVAWMMIHLLSAPMLSMMILCLDLTSRVFNIVRPVRSDQGFHIVEKS